MVTGPNLWAGLELEGDQEQGVMIGLLEWFFLVWLPDLWFFLIWL